MKRPTPEKLYERTPDHRAYHGGIGARLRVLVIATSLAICWTASAEEQPQLAVRAGKILTVTQGTVNHGVILIEDGRITAVEEAAHQTIPDGFDIIDATDKWVMPGLVEIHSHMACEGGLNDMVMPTNPELRTEATIDPEDPDIALAVARGVTTVHTIPGSGTNMAGFGVLYKLRGRTADEMIVRRLGAMKVAQAYNPERRGGDLGLTRMGMSWILRDIIDKGRNNTGGKDSGDPRWENMRDAVNGEIPTLVHTASAKDVMATARIFHDEYGLHTIVSHGTFDGYKVAGEMAKRDVHVNVGPRMFDFPFSADNRFYGLAAEYAAAGVEHLSICTDAPVLPQEDLFFQGSVAIHLGLDERTALEALTINSARAIGIENRVGSIEVGKDADLVIKGGSLFDVTIPVDMVLVNGEIAYRRDR